MAPRGEEVVLTRNGGASTLKFALYAVGTDVGTALASGTIETAGDHSASFDKVEGALRDTAVPRPTAVGHRIVHGGPNHVKHCLINDDVVADLAAASAFAPLHTPATLGLIRHAGRRCPGIPQAGCVDTAFHVSMPGVAKVLPIPRAYRNVGVHRYGFHGLPCESIVRQLVVQLPERLIVAHLGNGASATAVRHGQSVDASMGLTPSGGMIMGTRTGDLDPGVLLYLMRVGRLDEPALAELIDYRSGLLGLSGFSGDMRNLHAAASTNADADLAVRMFCGSVCKQIAAMAAALGGVDLVVLTGGIGENDLSAGTAIRDGLSWIRPCPVVTMSTLEDEQIALHTAALVKSAYE